VNGAPQTVTASLRGHANRTPLSLILCLVAAGMFLLGAARPCAAQSYVEGISDIFTSPDGSQVYTWSETYVSPDLATYYEAYVEGYAYQAGSEVGYGYNLGYPYWNDAIVEMYGVTADNSVYDLLSNHGVDAYWIYYANGTQYYYNPDGFLEGGGGGGGLPGSSDFTDGGGVIYVENDLIYLGSTAAELSTEPPVISSLNPTGAGVGTSGTITVSGSNLLDACTGNTAASVTGSGITLTVDSVSQDGTQAVLNYSITSNASTGSQTLTFTTCFGSGSASFQVGDPTPVITGVNPNNFPAGAQTSFIISGSGFGTAPTLAISGNGVTGYGITSSTDTQINATVTIGANAPSGIATITVTSTGYLGIGFVSTGGSGGSTNSAMASAMINGGSGPVPQIMFQGSNIANNQQNPQSVFAGQQIALTAVVNLPTGDSIATQQWSWSGNQGTSVAGFSATSTGGPGQVTPLTMSTTGNFTFYWVDTGNTRGVTYTYTSANGLENSATATFNVTGPTPASVSVMPSTDSVHIWPGGIVGQPGPYLEFGNWQIGGTPGVTLTASASPPLPRGSFVWVQLLTSDVSKFVVKMGQETCQAESIVGNPNAKPIIPPDPSPLDGARYPTGTGSTRVDSPLISLVDPYYPDDPNSQAGEGARPSFTAVTYLMWDPQIPLTGQQACTTGVDCTSIPIPLGTLTWGYASDAIGTLASYAQDLNNGLTPPGQTSPGDWIIHSGTGVTVPPPAPSITFQPTPPSQDSANYGYPKWINRDIGYVLCQ
jgi:hypothetical protein